MAENFNILNELTEAGAKNLIAAGNRNCFSVPANYFEDLPASIMSFVFVQSLPVYNPFSVPHGYFENFCSGIIKKINEQNNPVLKAGETAPYSIPDNYFDNLAENILARIKNQSKASEIEEELGSISPFLKSIPKTNVFIVPDNYFENLSPSVSKQHKPAKVISLENARKWMNYAAAACIIILMFGGGYFYLSSSSKYATTVSAAPEINVEEQIAGLSDEEIASYLHTNSNMAVYTNAGAEEDPFKNIDIQSMLQNVSDEEIQQYLDQNENPAPTAEEGI